MMQMQNLNLPYIFYIGCSMFGWIFSEWVVKSILKNVLENEMLYWYFQSFKFYV